MKSICILVQNHYEIDIRVRRKAEALVAAGYNVDVLALHSPYSKGKNYMLEGVNVYTFELSKKRGSLIRYAFEYATFLLWAFFKLSMLMGRRRYAAVDVNNLPDFLVFAALYAKLRGARVVFDMHEITPEFYMSKYGVDENHFKVRLSRWIERASMRFADHVITINEPIQKLLATRGLDVAKSSVITNSVDESIFASALQQAGTSGQPKDAGKFVMMYHGTMTRIYGLDIAIEALGLAKAEIPNAELWILGKGNEQASLQELARKLGVESKVRFVGSVLPQEIPAWLNQCDVGVLATRQDVFLDFSFSNKLSEYIIMGKGVICSRLKTIRHYFSEEALAYFEPHNAADLAKQMVRLCKDTELRRKHADKARLEYAPIRWEVMKDRYLKLMDSIAGVRAGATGRSSSAVASTPS